MTSWASLADCRGGEFFPIDRVVLIPAVNAPDGIDAQLHGDLAGVLALSNNDGCKQKLPADGAAGSLLSVVAGTRNHRELTLPPISV